MNCRYALYRLNIFNYNFSAISKQILVLSYNSLDLKRISIPCDAHNFKKTYRYVDVRSYGATSINLANSDSKMVITNILISYGFSEKDSNFIIDQCPNIRQINEENLTKNLNCWMQCQFGADRFTSLVLKYPNLLLIHPQNIKRLFQFLSTKYTKDYVYKIFSNAPQLLMDKEEMIEDKINYLENVMNAPKAQIVSSSTLANSLHHIKQRHEFLKRVGVFKLPDKKNLDHVNPRLDTIMSSSDEEFSTKVAGVTLLEFEVFQQLFNEEELDD